MARLPHTIRPATAADEAFLWTMLYHAIHVPPGEPPPPRNIVDRPELSHIVAGWMTREGDAGVITEVGGQPVGAAWMRLPQEDMHGYGYVDDRTPELSIALLPDYRGAGLGTALLTHLIEQARTAHPALSLSVSETNRAKQLYERLGFVPLYRDAGGSWTMLLRFE
ncbi:MAG: GNAT family N-acetyltransferase [Bacteroidota bacterium]